MAYPKDRIEAGDKFMVSVTYDAETMGHFDKYVGIYREGADKPTVWAFRL